MRMHTNSASSNASASEPWQMDATELAPLIRCGKVSSREATLSCLSRIDG